MTHRQNKANPSAAGGQKTSRTAGRSHAEAARSDASRQYSEAELRAIARRIAQERYAAEQAARHEQRSAAAHRDESRQHSRRITGRSAERASSGKRQRRSGAHKLLRRLAIVAGLLVVAFLVYAIAVIALAPEVDPSNIYDDIATSSVIYDDSGAEVETVNGGEDRTLIEYEQLPEDTVNAFVALEDKTFWEHHGFNWTRMIGAVVSSVGNGSISGTSTITQQLARNVYLSDIKSQRSIRRKILEMYYAFQIERSLSKEEIFTAYVNSIYFGFGCYGIENAAETYFSTDVSGLTLEESAALAAMPQSPDTYALLQNVSSDTTGASATSSIEVDGVSYLVNDISKDRRNTCLDLMLEQGYISQDEYDAAYDEDLRSFIQPHIVSDSDSDSAYFTDYLISVVIEDLQEEYDLDYTTASNMVYSGGLEIDSTLDAEAQQAVVEGFSDDSAFPSLTGLQKDSAGNIVDDDDSIILYAYSNMIEDGQFILREGEYRGNDDGSITILKNKRLNIYETTVDGETDYSLEFKPSYVSEDGDFYIYPGGYVNIPAESKSLDDDGNLVIDAAYIEEHEDLITDVDGSPAFSQDLYTMQSRVIQPQAAMVITEVGTGEVKAMVGGRGLSGRNLYNRAVQTRQPGSSIKPLAIYSTALQQSYEYAESGETFPYTDPGNDSQGTKYYGDYLTAASVIIDEPLTFNGKTWPKNSSGSYAGAMTMRRAMQNSVNTVAVKLYEQIGNDAAAEMVESFGIDTLDRSGDTNDMNAAALALGGLTNGVTPYAMAEAYATFPNGGTRTENRMYTEVRDKDGEAILSTKKTEHEVLDEGVAYIMTTMLQSVVSGGTGTNAAISGVSVGGKTGTTDNQYDIWFDGFTPSYAASLWIGTDVNIPLTSSSSAASALWGKIMSKISKAKEGSYPEKPDNVVRKSGEYFTEGTETGLSTKRTSSAQSSKQQQQEDDDTQNSTQPSATPSQGSGGSGGSDSGEDSGSSGASSGEDSGEDSKKNGA